MVLLVGRERHSDGYKMMNSASQRPAKKLAGIDRGGLPGGCQDITQRAVGEEQCAGPAADAGGRGIRVEREQEDKESLIKEHINTEKAIVFYCFQLHIL